jgi:GntR family transcriptional regulator, vanillate catabolism transcriptional regulator
MVTQIDIVANELRRRIGSAVYAPGERLVELNVSADLGVSRTPIRLAFEELTKEGLLERLPTRGFRVKAFSANELADAIDVRGVLEGMAARLVSERKLSDSDREVLQACVQEGQDLLRQAAGHPFVLDAPRWVAMNARFHATLITASGNTALGSAVTVITKMPLVGAQALSLHGIAPQLEHAFIQRAQQDHEDILGAILAGEGARAESLMREHARRSRDNKRILLTEALQP